MAEDRPDPDALLQAVTRLEPGRRGRLKIFFGASPGVGKTYAMLQEAQAELLAGRDIVAGVVETHGRAETAVQVEGLPHLPPREVQHRGVQLREFDLDAALQRQPELILVDELAHTNAPGSRHAKRWQDVDELLRAGIDVFSTLNVQHLESLNDVVAQISGVQVRETVPDSMLETADEIELIDISPDELLQRLRDGKVYLSQQAERALESFFTKANLTALRELALRRTAQQVDAQLQTERTLARASGTWPAAERIVVCVGPGPLAAGLVRTAKRLADEIGGEWDAVFIQTASSASLPEAAQARVQQTLRLAEQLGGRAVTLDGERVADTLVAYARKRNATKILVGKPTHPQWIDRLRGSLVDAVIRQSGDIDVYVVRTPPGGGERPPTNGRHVQARQGRIPDYLLAVVAVAMCTLVAFAVRHWLQPVNLVALYLLAVALVATRASRGATVIASILAIVAFNFFFIPPHFTLVVHEVQYLITLAAMLLIGLLIADLTYRLRRQALQAGERERQTATLYQLSQELSRQHGVGGIMSRAEKGIAEICECRASIVRLNFAAPEADAAPMDLQGGQALQNEKAVAKWVAANGKPAGLGTATLAAADALYLPLGEAGRALGVLVIRPRLDFPDEKARLSEPRYRQLLEACASLVTIALDRELRQEAEQLAHARADREQLRSILLSSISHDLRTPLAGITGSAETLQHLPPEVLKMEGQGLLQGIRDEGQRMLLLVENILDLTRLESGGLSLKLEPQVLEELVGSALRAVEARTGSRAITVHLPGDLPLVQADSVLIERVLVNLLDNAFKHTPASTAIALAATVEGDVVKVSVSDEGPGLSGDGADILDPQAAARREGLGLGLLICKAIVEAHNGILSAGNRPGGGAVFSFTLPVSQVGLAGGEP